MYDFALKSSGRVRIPRISIRIHDIMMEIRNHAARVDKILNVYIVEIIIICHIVIVVFRNNGSDKYSTLYTL